MAGKINKIVNLLGNMGFRYVAFRAQHEIFRRSGMLKKKFPAAPAYQQYLTLAQWKEQSALFFFTDKESLSFPRSTRDDIRERFEQLKSGKLILFNSMVADLGTDYDWITNPDSGFKYDISKHWTEINDFSKEAGDIKFVWEKSRFSYLYDIIRYDYHFNEDCSAMVFGDILDWIRRNPINCGPNYRCSQEMSLRVLNWTFALHYYRNSPNLTSEVFDQMQYAIYWHMHHVYNNIHFSRIAVRNNHAITETLTLYIAGLLYPSLPGAAMWKQRGKAWFEEEIAYQIYDDGTFLQYSMNYHRVVMQLLTWAITIADVNKERFSDVVYQRAKRSFIFLRTCMVDENGQLPNYGANDGSIFFRLNSAEYRDYRPQLQALALAVGSELKFNDFNEDAHWFGIFENARKTWQPENGVHCFEKGGYYIIREPQTLTFIKCGSYSDRPQHADGLHLDVWYKGENLLLDGGSYKYNVDDKTAKYFSGTQSHNTVMLNDLDQMLKGGRFIWYYWTSSIKATLTGQKEEGAYVFSGAISAFRYVNKDIVHCRTVVKQKGVPEWSIRDEIVNMPAGMAATQLWHLPRNSKSGVKIKAETADGTELTLNERQGWFSGLYGVKEASRELCFSTTDATIITTIKIK